MGWVAVKPFRYRGKSYAAGDEVPAEKWPNKNGLKALRRIRFDPAPAPIPENVDVTSLKRAELNTYATSIGIEDAVGFANRELLLEAVQARLDATKFDSGEATPPPAPDEEPEAETEVEDEEDDLFADTSDDVDGTN